MSFAVATSALVTSEAVCAAPAPDSAGGEQQKPWHGTTRSNHRQRLILLTQGSSCREKVRKRVAQRSCSCLLPFGSTLKHRGEMNVAHLQGYQPYCKTSLARIPALGCQRLRPQASFGWAHNDGCGYEKHQKMPMGVLSQVS